ncbi:hypothetical protein B0T10DRAFT_538251 [Thelonectria olida]|uniref:E3 ubiquitin-protein ligase CCNB1IP1 n=1 Tax=Thelonectria olida TaxID=1576542 RepID=A0A9P9AQ00_9HYPO|nr:hypothetical protein B0T10DRAFT_538251 [Thelonectria olida]
METSSQNGPRSACPACNCQLNSPDDAAITNLNPSEEYKTSVLSGLSPNVIMECAGRALSFWAYQMTQDIFYQQYLYKTLTNKYSNLSLRLEKTINDANSEIEALQQKITSLAADQDSLRRKNMEISQAYKEKSRKHLQVQEAYDKIRRRAEIGHIQQAASDEVDSSLSMAPQMGHSFGGATNHNSVEAPMRPSFGQNHRIDVATTMNASAPRSHNTFSREDGRWPRAGTNVHAETSYAPVGGLHRHAVGSSSHLSGTSTVPGHTGTPAPGPGAKRHSPGSNAPSFANNRVGLTGVGLTSGLKVSQPANMPGLDVSARRH